MMRSERSYGLTYRQPNDNGLKAAIRNLWDDLPLFLAPLVIIGFGLLLLLPTGLFQNARGLGLLKTIVPSGEVWGIVFIALGIAKFVGVLYVPRMFIPAVMALTGGFLLLSISAGLGHAWGGLLIFAAFGLLSLWGPFHVTVIPARRN